MPAHFLPCFFFHQIFTCFVAVAKDVHRQLGGSGWSGELLTGETPSHKRQAMVDNFQVRVELNLFWCPFLLFCSNVAR